MTRQTELKNEANERAILVATWLKRCDVKPGGTTLDGKMSYADFKVHIEENISSQDLRKYISKR